MTNSQNNNLREITEKIVIATTTFYNPNNSSDNYRSNLAKKTIKNATDLGYKIIVVDGGSSEKILREFEKYGAQIYSQTSNGMGNSRRQAITEAYSSGKEIIAWMEPEKNNYINKIIDTAIPILNNSAEIVIPKRKSLKSYPLYQQYAERFGNEFWKELTGTNLDMWFGPRTWRKESSNYFLNNSSTNNNCWDSIFIPIMNAIIDNKKVISVEIDYTHPKKQTELEEHNLIFYKKRLEQLENLIPALETYWNKSYNKLI